MTTVKLTNNAPFEWHFTDEVCSKGYCFAPDGKLYRDSDLCDFFSSAFTEPEFSEKLMSANGRFAVVVRRQNTLWMGVDRLRSYPLFYSRKDNNLLIADNVDELFEPDEAKELDSDSVAIFSGLSYVTGNKTLLKDIFQLQAGEYLIYDGNSFSTAFYHRLFANIRNIDFETARLELNSILDRVAGRMMQLIGERPVYLSLSGGLDSRIIACMLKKYGKENVTCFTYGVKTGNPEWKRSKAVAEKLNYRWQFFDYSAIDSTDFHRQEIFVRFYKYVSQYVSKIGLMPYFACRLLNEEATTTEKPVALTGDGGDFFAGSHLREYMKFYKNISVIAKDLQYIHCDLVKLNHKERRLIGNTIKNELSNEEPLFCNVENWDLKERQVKYILNAGKLYDFFGMEYQIPLCDNEIMDFFVSLPFDYRLNKKLYKTVVYEWFKKYDIFFKEDEITSQASVLQRIKIIIKRLFPFLRRNNNLFKYDYFDFRRISVPLIEELKSEKCKRKILTSNGITSEWYLLQVRKMLSSFQ